MLVSVGTLGRRNSGQIPLKHFFLAARNSNKTLLCHSLLLIQLQSSQERFSTRRDIHVRPTTKQSLGTASFDFLPRRIESNGTIDGRRSRTGNKSENATSVSEGGSFPPDEDILEEFLGDEPMRPGRALGGSAVESAVDGVQLGTEFTSDVEPPVADEHRLAELRPVWTEKRRLAAVYVAVVPRLAPCLDVREETRVRLVVAVEVRVRDFAQHWVVRACSTCKAQKRIVFDID